MSISKADRAALRLLVGHALASKIKTWGGLARVSQLSRNQIDRLRRKHRSWAHVLADLLAENGG